MKYAVVKTGGKQYKVSEGDVINVERLPVEASDDYTFNEVLLYVSDAETKVGMPTVSDVVVKAKVLEKVKGEKIRVSKFKAKSRYRRVTGHRQALTRLKVESIQTKGEKAAQKEIKPEKKSVKQKNLNP